MKLNNVVINSSWKDCLIQFNGVKFDLVLADPPYFSGPERRAFYGNKVSKTGIKRINYPVSKKWEIPTAADIDELISLSEHQIIFGCNYFKYLFGPGRIIWDKVNYHSTFSDCEEAFCSYHNSIRLFRFMWNGAMQGKSIYEGHIMQGDKRKNEKRIHPTQKPVALYRWIYRTYLKPGMSVFDPYVGSGSSRIAAYEEGVNFYGAEIDEEHFNRQQKRFDNHTAQLKLNF